MRGSTFCSELICCVNCPDSEWNKAGQHCRPPAGSVYNDCYKSLMANDCVIGSVDQ